MQNLIKKYTPRRTKLHIISKFSRWEAWPLACVQLISLFLYENSHFSFRMLSKYTLKRIKYKMFSIKISESYNQTQTYSYNHYFFIQNMFIFKEFFQTQSDQIYAKTHKTASYFQNFLR